MNVDLDEAKQAAKLLVTAHNAVDLYGTLSLVIRRAGLLPVRLIHPYSVMNPLLDLYRNDRTTYDTIIKWVLTKRKEFGLPALMDERAQNKNEYMREFMHELRTRWRKAVYVENLLRSEKDKLKGESRRQFEKRCSKEWAVQRDRLLEAERQRLGLTNLPQETLHAILKHFWENVDRQLEEREEAMMAQLRKPVYQRQPVAPSMQALRSALESDPE